MYKGKREAGEQRRSFWPVWFPLVLFFQELVLHIWAFGTVHNVLLILLFSLALGTIFNLFCCLWGKTGNRIAAGVLTVLSTLWLCVQTVYFTIFRTFLTVYSIGGAGDAAQYWREALTGIMDAALPLLLLLLPAVVFFVWGRRFAPQERAGRKVLALAAGCAAVLQFSAAVAVNLSTEGVFSPRYLYYQEFIPERSVQAFGALTTLRLDVTQLLGLNRADLLPAPEIPEVPTVVPEVTPDTQTPEDTTPEVPEEPEIVYGPNVMEIDFEAFAAERKDKTLQKLDAWFAGREPTMQNEYTGRFAGKNLLWFTAEGFSRFAVDPVATPTLYKLSNSGFVFENFYNPLWWASTIDGEYVACTSLIPKSGVWSLYHSGDNSMYFCMGNQLRALGYDTRAYHNHSYSYYKRDVSHPNLGYDYKGLGNGLKVTKMWPESDLEMMQVTLPEFVSEDPFHVYFMTVSGHMNYNFPGNSMALKHKNEVGHEEWGEGARAYLACQMELDQALEYTLNYLEETGHLEDTVICLSGDHYPYGLDDVSLTELNGGEPVDMRFDVYRSTMILWCGDMEETITISEPCSSLDILPTLSNLFGVEYDSRLLMGRDILSDAEPLVVLSDRSFITQYGRYDAKADVFTPVEGVEVPEGYAAAVLQEVNQMFTNSKAVLEQDYYAKIGLFHEPPAADTE